VRGSPTIRGVNEERFTFRLTSFQPNKHADSFVAAAVASTADIEAHLKAKGYEGVSITVNREQGVPVDLATAQIFVTAAAGAVAAGFLGKVGEEIYEYLRKRLKGAKVDRG
jgi:hypothetical protein